MSNSQQPSANLPRGPLSDRERELMLRIEDLLQILRETPYCDGVYGDHAFVREAQQTLTKIRMEIRPSVASRFR